MKTNDYSKSYLFFICFVSAMGGLLFGYDWVVIGGAKVFYETFFQIGDSVYLQGWAMSSALTGCLIGALTAGMASDRYGRKKMLVASAVLFLVSAIGTGATGNFAFFVLFRITGGIGIGVASSLSPMYIAEIAPAKMRGRLVSLNQMTIVTGILMAQIMNWLIADPVAEGIGPEDLMMSWNVQMGWRWMFWAMAVPAICFLCFSLLLPESPRWLAINSRKEEALKIWRKFLSEEDARSEYDNVMRSAAFETKESIRSGLSKLLHPSMRNVLIIGIVLAVLQQWCGINIIFNYSHEIFSAAGYGVSDILMNIVVTGVTNVVFTVVAIFLVDKLGRKPLLLIGAGGLASIYIILDIAYWFNIAGIAMLILVVLAIACYAMTLAPIMWVMLSEIFPNRIRGIAMSVATFALWAAAFIITYTFPILNEILGSAGVFWLYSAICFAGFIFILRKVPETKNKTLEEIESELVVPT